MKRLSRMLQVAAICAFLTNPAVMDATVETLVVGGVAVESGTKKSWDLHAGETALGPVMIPVTVINGREDGPHLAVTAACHPMELTGVMTTIRLGKGD